MKRGNKQRGFSAPVVIAVLALVLVVGGVAYYNTRPAEEIMNQKAEDMMREGEKMMKTGNEMMRESREMMNEAEGMSKNSDEGAMMEESMMEEGSEEMVFSGEILAGGESKLLDFERADYEKAFASDKLIALYFYANWCPTCQAEFPKMQKAFDELETGGVVGFRVNFNDNQTDSFEKELAREFGVAYQHTKVFVKNGERILKSPETWEKSRYLSEIQSRI